MTTKVHAVTDGLGNPLRFLLSSGNRNDICMAQALLESFTLNGKLILAGKGYDSDKFVHWVEERGGIRPLAKLSKAVKVADTSNQGKSEGKALSAKSFLRLRQRSERIRNLLRKQMACSTKIHFLEISRFSLRSCLVKG